MTAVPEGAEAQVVLLAAAFGRSSACWLDLTAALMRRAIGRGDRCLLTFPYLKGAFQGQFRLGVVVTRSVASTP